MRITKPIRDTAALLCALMASSNRDTVDGMFIVDFEAPMASFVDDNQLDFREACETIGVECMSRDGAAELAREAYTSTQIAPHRCFRAEWAEAEAMLRTGWTP